MATLGMASPSVLIITVVAVFLQALITQPIVQHALMGIRGAVCALMLNTVYSLAKKSLVRPVWVVLCGAAFMLTFFTEIPTVLIIVLAAMAGIVVDRVEGGTEK